MSRVKDADQWVRPTWATVGLDITLEELQKSNRDWEEGRTRLPCGLLVLCSLILLAYLIHLALKWTRTQSSSETLWAKMEALEERLATLKENLQRVNKRMLTHKKAVPHDHGAEHNNVD